jgi:hypothetical protein
MPRMPRAACIAILLLVIVVGAKRNVYDETRWVLGQYRDRVLPAYQFVRERDEEVVAVSHVKLTAELCGLMDAKIFFGATDDAQFEKMVKALRARGIDQFLYIAEGDVESEYDSPIKHAVAATIDAEPLGRYGAHFYCYAARIPQE